LADAATEPAAPERVAPEASDSAPEPPPEAPGESYAAYWRWMHAQLDAHLEQGDADDLGSPPPPLPRLAFSAASRDPLQALAPSTAVGIRDREAFSARAFQGLSDGITRLG
jgi:hypothetical protein